MSDLSRSHADLLSRLSHKLRVANLREAEITADDAAARAPVVTGQLRDSIHAVDTTVETLKPTAEIRADAPYAAYVNNNTGFMTGPVKDLAEDVTRRVAGQVR